MTDMLIQVHVHGPSLDCQKSNDGDWFSCSADQAVNKERKKITNQVL